MPAQEPTERKAASDLAYSLAVTAFYLFAIGANAWVLYEQYHDTPQARAITARLRTVRARVAAHADLWRDRVHFRRAANRMLWEADTIVPGAVVAVDDQVDDA